MKPSSKWLAEMNDDWQIVNPKLIFEERSGKSLPDDVHLTPSQIYGVLPQTEYMEKTGTGVVLNLVGPDNMKHVEKDDFIIHLRSFQGGIEHSPYDGKVSNAYCVLKAKSGVEPRFFRWVLKSSGYIQELNSTTNQLRDGQSIKFEQFASIGLPFPSIDEQRRIADYLDSQIAVIDLLVTLKNSQISRYWESASSQFADLFLQHTSESIPLKWLIEDERLGIWGSEQGQEPLDVYVARVADFDRWTYRLGDVPTVRSVETSKFQSRKVSIGDLLLERSGGGAKSPVGCAVYVDREIENLVSSNFVSRLRPANGVDGRYLSLLFAALYMTGQQTPHSSQTTGIQNLDTESYFQTLVPKLALDKQVELMKEGERIISATFQAITKFEESEKALRALKMSLITAAVTGTFDVTTGRSVA